MYTCFVDLEKAFDSIDRDMLWEKLNRMGLPKNNVEILKSLYENYKVCIKMDKNMVTECISTSRGLRQGCQLSDILFALYINDFPKKMKKIESHAPMLSGKEIEVLLYADDMVLLSQTGIGLQRALQQLQEYCVQNKLKVNEAKPKILVFRKGVKLGRDEIWRYGNTVIQNVNKFNYLGITFNWDGKWEKHFEEVRRKAIKGNYVIAKFMYCNPWIPANVPRNLEVQRQKR